MLRKTIRCGLYYDVGEDCMLDDRRHSANCNTLLLDSRIT